MPKHIFIVAGEASGDIHGANLVRELKTLSPDVVIAGFGGHRMEAAGLNSLYNLADLAVIGFYEVIKNLLVIRKLLKVTEKYFREQKPQAVVLIDYPGFNFKVGKLAKKHGIPVVYYIAPQVWAWWPGRVQEIKQFAAKVLVIFSFEEEIYKKEQIPVTWVGHPLIEHVPPDGGLDIYRKYKLDPAKKLIGLLPGSRRQEIEHLLPAMLDAVRDLVTKRNDLEFVCLRSASIEEKIIRAEILRSKLPVKVLDDPDYQIRRKLTLAMVASGTATLEMAYLGIPMLIVYKVNPLSFFLAKRLVKIPYIGLANIVSGQKVVPEFIQHDVHGPDLARQVQKFLENPAELKAVREKLLQVREKLGTTGAAKRAAQEILAIAGAASG
jgi:lipid-A-disaccharide synthase